MNELIRYRKLFFVFALIACIGGMIGDLFLLYFPGVVFEAAGTAQMDYHFLLQKSPEALLIGQCMGLAILPLHFFGFLIVLPLLNQVPMVGKILICFLAFLLLLYGTHHHGIMLATQMILDTSHYPEWLAHTLRPLETMIGLLFALISFILGYEIKKGRTLYSNKAIAALPIFSYLVWIVLYALKLPGSNAILAMGLNISFLIFFTVSYVQLQKIK